MSGIDYTTDALLETTRTDCLTPEADALLTDPRLLSILTFEQMTTLVPQIMEVQEEYFVHVIDIAIDTSKLPTRCRNGPLERNCATCALWIRRETKCICPALIRLMLSFTTKSRPTQTNGRKCFISKITL
jgi:hypothetical protein